MITKAFAYLRVSGKGQIEGDGFDRQTEAIKRYANANGIKVVHFFREEGVSGTKDMENRPALMEMLEALHSNGVRLILVESLNRLARDLMVQESILRDLKNHEFTLVSVTEPDLCSDDPTRKLMRQILGAFAEYEKSMIVLKLRGARNRTKARHGRCEGRKPYGYYEGESEVLRQIQEMRQLGMGFDRIAAALNDQGVKPRNAKAVWHGSTVNSILTVAAKAEAGAAKTAKAGA